jgi:hypothetical protein
MSSKRPVQTALWALEIELTDPAGDRLPIGTDRPSSAARHCDTCGQAPVANVGFATPYPADLFAQADGSLLLAGLHET